MRLIIPVLINCILVLGVYLANRHPYVQKMSYVKKQIIIGVLFGGVSAFASSYGVDWLGATVNVRDAAPLSAGLIFGAPAGIIAGVIGGLYRWFSVYWGGGEYTQLACSLATILAGLMAAGLRRLMFDDKKPTWVYGIFIAVTCEVVHMILIFVTNMDNSSYAFEFVKGATLPMVLGNAAAVGIALLAVSLLSKERFVKQRGSERIAQTFQRWLLACIVIAFAATSLFTFSLQNGIVSIETQEVFTSAMNDVETDIRGKSNAQLLEIAYNVKNDYEDNVNVSLEDLAVLYDLVEINVVDGTGVIVKSNKAENVNFDMDKTDQSRQFLEELQTEPHFVQEYGPMGMDNTKLRKYAGVNLADGGFVQVGYDAAQFHTMINEFVIDVTKNRHVGTDGFVAVCDENLRLVIDDDEYKGAHISTIGIIPEEEMLTGTTATRLYEADIVDGKTEVSVKHVYVFKFIEGYYIIAAMPQSEATFMRDASIYTSLFMQVLIFAALFVFIYVLIKRVIINNLRKINNTLGQITGGDLNVTVDVRSNEEFASLSDDINSTVSTLKRYIAEAAARIDKELEYAKQIQLSALPTNFPTDENYTIFAQMIAAKEVGGDFYDFYKLNDTTVAFLVADVSGKGIPAAMFMMTAKTIIKDLAERGLPVNEILTNANHKLCENNESGMFVTVWMAIVDVTTGKMQFANAGHNPPLLKRADGSLEYLKTRPGLVLAGMDGVKYRASEITLGEGDRLFLYTDGVSEATNADNQLYGEDRLYQFVKLNSLQESTTLLPALKANIDAFVGDAPQFDDITMLMFDYKSCCDNAQMVTQSFPAKTQALNDVIAFVEQHLEQHECPLKTQMALCVAIEEVFVNVANYAYGDGEGDVDLGIAFDQQTNTITFRMADRGVQFDPLQKPDPDVTLSAEQRQIGGLGIFITKKTMDSITYCYENGENVLTMTKKI